jgi:hypothetical protein
VGVEYLRCTGPSGVAVLTWKYRPAKCDSEPSWSSKTLERIQCRKAQQEEGALLDRLQEQWLSKVAQGCAHARVGITIRGLHCGLISTAVLAHILSFTFGGSTDYLHSSLSTQRATPTLLKAIPMPTSRLEVAVQCTEVAEVGGRDTEESTEESEPVKKKARIGTANITHDQQPRPRLALISLSLAVGLVRWSVEAKGNETEPALGVVGTSASILVKETSKTNGDQGCGCEWLHGLGAFIQNRHARHLVNQSTTAKGNIRHHKRQKGKAAKSQSSVGGGGASWQ